MAAAQAKQAKVLRIGIIQEGKIVQERLIDAGESVTVGDSANNTFVFSTSKLPRKEFPLFVSRRAGYVLNFTKAMRGKISSGGAVVGLDKLRNDPSVTRRSDTWGLPLTEQDRGKINIDNVTVLFQFVPPPPTQVVQPLQAMDFRPKMIEDDDPLFMGFFAIFAALAMVLLVWVWNTDPPEVRGFDEIPDRFTKLVIEEEPPEYDEMELEIDEDLEGPGRTEEKAEPEPGSGSAEDDGAKEPQTAVEKAVAREEMKQDVLQKSLLIKMLVTRGESTGGTAVDLWSDEDAGLGDLDAAVKGVKGVVVATEDNQGLREGTMGGTEDVEISDMTRGTGGKTEIGGGPDIKVEGDMDVGAVDLSDVPEAQAIKSVVDRNSGGVLFCYERELKADPNLQGRVEVEFNISRGRVTSATIFANTTGSAALGTCIIGKVQRWRGFPEDIDQMVVFPFIFRPKG